MISVFNSIAYKLEIMINYSKIVIREINKLNLCVGSILGGWCYGFELWASNLCKIIPWLIEMFGGLITGEIS